MWEIYDALIAGVPDDLAAESIVCGYTNTIVTSKLGAGISSVLDCTTRHPIATGDLIGRPLREVGELIKSWNYPEAAIGHAALNSYYNSPSVARSNGIDFSELPYREDRLNDPFITSQNEVRGKKVAVVGHFPYLETFFEPVCDLYIIEWEPEEQGDYPLSSCEYILPQCDYIFLSCRSLVDKSFPRLLALSKNAIITAVVGPATTLAPYLLTVGVGDLAGFVISDPLQALHVVSGAKNGNIYGSGHKVSMKRMNANN